MYSGHAGHAPRRFEARGPSGEVWIPWRRPFETRHGRPRLSDAELTCPRLLDLLDPGPRPRVLGHIAAFPAHQDSKSGDHRSHGRGAKLPYRACKVRRREIETYKAGDRAFVPWATRWRARSREREPPNPVTASTRHHLARVVAALAFARARGALVPVAGVRAAVPAVAVREGRRAR